MVTILAAMSNNEHLLAAGRTNQGDHALDHINDGVTIITVFFAAPKDGINNHAVPNHLQGLKSLFLLVGRLYTMTFLSFVIIHDHSVNCQFDYRTNNARPPRPVIISSVTSTSVNFRTFQAAKSHES